MTTLWAQSAIEELAELARDAQRNAERALSIGTYASHAQIDAAYNEAVYETARAAIQIITRHAGL